MTGCDGHSFLDRALFIIFFLNLDNLVRRLVEGVLYACGREDIEESGKNEGQALSICACLVTTIERRRSLRDHDLLLPFSQSRGQRRLIVLDLSRF